MRTIVVAATLALLGVLTAFAAGGDSTADRVFGQFGSFVAGNCDAATGNVGESILCRPRGVAMDSAGHLYVADTDNSRVLEYDAPLGCTPTPCDGGPATRVFGQLGSFTSGACNMGALNPSNSTLCDPIGIKVDSAGHLWVADYGNSRVLEYDSPLCTPTPCDGGPANHVVGQPGFTTRFSNQGGSANANSLNLPTDVAVDGTGHLYIADNANNRVLRYDTPLGACCDPAADGVFGQLDFTSTFDNFEGRTGRTLLNPFGVAVDSAGHLYIADSANDRVLEFESPLGPNDPYADRVFGQLGSLTSGDCSSPSASSLCHPAGVIVDGAGHLWLADGNNRVLEYDSPRGCTPTPCDGGPANRVFGQLGSFSTNGGCCAHTSADTLRGPLAVAVDAAINLYIADTSNSRVLEYNGPSNPVGGIAEQPDVATLPARGSTARSNGYAYPLGVSGAGLVLLTVLAVWWRIRRRAAA